MLTRFFNRITGKTDCRLKIGIHPRDIFRLDKINGPRWIPVIDIDMNVFSRRRPPVSCRNTDCRRLTRQRSGGINKDVIITDLKIGKSVKNYDDIVRRRAHVTRRIDGNRVEHVFSRIQTNIGKAEESPGIQQDQVAAVHIRDLSRGEPFDGSKVFLRPHENLGRRALRCRNDFQLFIIIGKKSEGNLPTVRRPGEPRLLLIRIGYLNRIRCPRIDGIDVG